MGVGVGAGVWVCYQRGVGGCSGAGLLRVFVGYELRTALKALIQTRSG